MQVHVGIGVDDMGVRGRKGGGATTGDGHVLKGWVRASGERSVGGEDVGVYPRVGHKEHVGGKEKERENGETKGKNIPKKKGGQQRRKKEKKSK